MKQIHIRIDDDIHKKLLQYSATENQTIQEYVGNHIKQLFIKTDKKSNNDNNYYSFIDLFAGIGGMRLAFEKSKAKCVYSNEWNKYSQQTYFANFGELPEGDITKVDAKDIPDHDILVAGFPCQPFSIAGVSKKTAWDGLLGLKIKLRELYFLTSAVFLKKNALKPLCWKM